MQKPDFYIIVAVLLILGAVEIIALVLAGATNEAVAVWVQALGGLLLVGAAIIVPVAQNRAKAADRLAERRERAHAFMLTYAGQIFAACHVVARLAGPVKQNMQLRPTLGNPDAFLQSLEVAVADELAAAMVQTMDMDAQVLEPLRNFLIGLESINNVLRQIQWPCTPEQWTGAMTILENTRKRVEDLGQKVIDTYKARPA